MFPGQIEVYVLTRRRDEETINRFLDEYVDSEASEEVLDDELLLVPLESEVVGNLGRLFDVEPATSLTHTVQRGLDYPRRGFFVNLEPRHSEFLRVALCFTTDDRLVFGLVLEDTDERKRQADSKLQKVMTDYDGYLGMVTMFESPPRSEAEFRGMEGKPLVLHFVERPPA